MKHKIEIYEAEDVIKLEEDGVTEEVTIESYDLIIGEELVATVYDYGNAQRLAEMINNSDVEIEIVEGID